VIVPPAEHVGERRHHPGVSVGRIRGAGSHAKLLGQGQLAYAGLLAQQLGQGTGGEWMTAQDCSQNDYLRKASILVVSSGPSESMGMFLA